MNVRVVNVGSIAEQIRGVSYSKEDASDRLAEGMIAILRASNITEDGLVFDDLVYVPDRCVNPRQRIKKGDIVIAASSGSIDVVGKAAPVLSDAEAAFGAFCKVVRPGPDVSPSYLAHYFRTATYRRIISSLAAGANINNLRSEHIDELQLPLPKPEEQNRIASILDKADAIRRKRQQALRLTDDFLRSVFLDMFGDPLGNPHNWPTRTFGEIVSDTKLGLVRSSEEFGWDLPVPYVRMDAITNSGAFLPEKVQRTNATPSEITDFGLSEGDFLFNTRNSKELVGKVAIYPGPSGATFNNNLMRVRFIPGVDPYFICHQFQFDKARQDLETRKQGTTSVYAVYWKNLSTMPILVPPPEMQRAFRIVVEKVKAARAKLENSASESDQLFFSLQQRAFSGQL